MPGFIGQGKVLVGLRQASGLPGLLRWLGNSPKFSMQLDEDTAQRNESYTGSRLPFRKATKARTGTISAIFDEMSNDNLALGLFASITAVAPGSPVVGQVFPTGAKVGNVLPANGKNLSALAVKDSTGAVKTLTSGVNYIGDLFAGTAELIDITTGGPYIQPFKLDYTPGAYTKVGAFNQASQDLYVRFDGVNTDDGSRIVCDIFRNRLKPLKEFVMIGDDYHDFELSGQMLADPTRAAAGADGQFFSIVTP